MNIQERKLFASILQPICYSPCELLTIFTLSVIGYSPSSGYSLWR